MRIRLEDICKRIYAGGDVPKDRYSTEKTERYSVPIYANAEKDFGLYGYTDTAREFDTAITVAARGTIGFTAIRTEPFLPVVRLITVVPETEKVTAEYLYYALKNCKPKSSGTSIPQLTVPDIKKYSFNIYDLKEQQRITDVLGRIEHLIEKRQSEIDKLDNLIKARFVEMFGEPIANPMNWPVKRLKELSILITNGNTPKGGSENYVESGITFLRSQNVWRNRIELDDVVYINEATHKSMRKSSLHRKDILITKTGRINTENSSLGRAALFLGEDDSANINGHVYLVRLNGSVVPEYVVTILTGEAYRRYIRKVCVGGIDKRQINVDQVEEFPIIMPPYEQQKQFAAFVAQVDKSKVAVQKALDETQLLFESLMQNYFG